MLLLIYYAINLIIKKEKSNYLQLIKIIDLCQNIDAIKLLLN